MTVEPVLVPVSVITGFLGAGKTTLLKNLLLDQSMADCALVINEAGEVALDHVLAQRVDDATVVLASGCVCCTVRSDLARALVDLLDQHARGLVPSLGRIVVETTGLADPAPLLVTLLQDSRLAHRVRLDGVITVVDAQHGLAQLQNRFENLKQVAMADCLVISKTDLIDAPTQTRLEQQLKRLNPGATILYAQSLDPRPGGFAPKAQDWLSWGLYNPQKKTIDVRRWLQISADNIKLEEDAVASAGQAHLGTRSYTFTYQQPLLWDELVQALDMVLSVAGDKVLRLKGVVVLQEPEQAHAISAALQVVAIHAVHHHLYPVQQLDLQPDEVGNCSHIVFIVQDLDRNFLQKALDYFISTGSSGLAGQPQAFPQEFTP
jgi:G3E family GTPase